MCVFTIANTSNTYNFIWKKIIKKRKFDDELAPVSSE